MVLLVLLLALSACDPGDGKSAADDTDLGDWYERQDCNPSLRGINEFDLSGRVPTEVFVCCHEDECHPSIEYSVHQPSNTLSIDCDCTDPARATVVVYYQEAE